MELTIEEIVSRECKKEIPPSKSYDEEEETFQDVAEEEHEVELPFEDILAETRRKYSAKEEFTYLLYNDALKYFVKEWDGKYLRKMHKQYADDNFDDISMEGEYDDQRSDNKDYSVPKENSWKLSLPDEFANITFVNNNTYSGRISRKMMEGEGIYTWSNGSRYKGEFQQNRIHGKGLLEWTNACWYEGDFVNGLRHGKGIMVDGESRFMYTGYWFKGQRYGKGYCRYGDNGSYDGNWVMDKMNGVGLRIYPSGARYMGHWENGIRHGVGTMVWTNGNVYRGEWKCGTMDGYGEYIWNGFFNKTFTLPQLTSYIGYWRNGMRHGQGELKLGSIGGARYSGNWKDNKKHGHGIIIGNNGERFEANPLFLNDILCSGDTANNTSEPEIERKKKCVRDDAEIKPLFIEKPNQLAEAPDVPVLKPEQFPCLTYHLTRLLKPKNLEPHFVPSVESGKCYKCEKESCSCLAHPTPIGTSTSSSEACVETLVEISWKYEERWVHNCLTLHMFRLRKIYNDYATLFTKVTPSFNLSMSRLCLWQLWRDSDLHSRGYSLVDIDNYIAKNETAIIKDPHDPFERIEIWQFLHALMEVSWQLYTKCNNVDANDMNGKIAAGLHKLLERDIYPRVGNHVGALCHENFDLLPVDSVFELYRRIGYPPSATDFLRSTCVLMGTADSKLSSTTDETETDFPDGINTVAIGEKVSYLLKRDELFASSRCTIGVRKNGENDLSNELLVFKKFGAPKMLEMMSSVCPGITNATGKIIINMDYKLTFLEFYEIILEATKRLLSSKKEAEKDLQRKNTEDKTLEKATSLQENTRARDLSSNGRVSTQKNKSTT